MNPTQRRSVAFRSRGRQLENGVDREVALLLSAERHLGLGPNANAVSSPVGEHGSHAYPTGAARSDAQPA